MRALNLDYIVKDIAEAGGGGFGTFLVAFEKVDPVIGILWIRTEVVSAENLDFSLFEVLDFFLHDLLGVRGCDYIVQSDKLYPVFIEAGTGICTDGVPLHHILDLSLIHI